jgi:hypothetical protein
MKKLILHAFLLASLAFTFSQCKKLDIPMEPPTAVREEDPTNIAGVLPFPLDWENINFMPTPPGAQTIIVPWGSGANQLFDPAIAFDYKKTDGWELVYNTFSATTTFSPNFFVLYNRYRGLMRVYLYLVPNSPTPTTYMNHGLALSGSGNSSMLNYIAQDVVEVGTNIRATNQSEPYQLQATGGWHVFQYEIAYDPAISSTSFNTLNFVCRKQSVNVTQLNLYGSITGGLTGTIGQNSSSPILGSFFKGVLSGVSKAAVSAAITGVPFDVKSAITKALDKGAAGLVENIFNGIFGGGSTPVQQVNLKFNADVNLTGTLTNSIGISIPTLAIPGSSNSIGAPGLSPGFNNIMGVFNLSARPRVNTVNVVSGSPINVPGGFGAQEVPHRHTYTIDNSSYSIIYNPAVINSSATGAAIQNVKQELVLFSSGTYSSNTIGGGVRNTITDGLKEQVGSTKIITNLTFSDQYQARFGTSLPFNQSHGRLGIRISFDVVPNNGSPRLKIIKTFAATQVFI